MSEPLWQQFLELLPPSDSRSGSFARVEDLCDDLGVTPSDLTRFVRRADHRGFVVRKHVKPGQAIHGYSLLPASHRRVRYQSIRAWVDVAA